MIRHHRRALVGAVLVAVLLGGCAQAPAYEAETAERLQSHVLAVSTSTAEGDWAGASTRLMELEASASTALARGEITQERYDAIMSALQLVRTDVDTALAAAAAEAERQRLADEEAARQRAEEAERAEQAQQDDDKGKGDDKKKDDAKDDEDDD